MESLVRFYLRYLSHRAVKVQQDRRRQEITRDIIYPYSEIQQYVDQFVSSTVWNCDYCGLNNLDSSTCFGCGASWNVDVETEVLTRAIELARECGHYKAIKQGERWLEGRKSSILSPLASGVLKKMLDEKRQIRNYTESDTKPKAPR